MKSELVVDVQAAEVSTALLEDGRLVSLQKEARNIAYAVGDIYLAKVKKLMPGLNAAFVNVGYEKDAFLHYLDLGAHFSSYAEFLRQLLADKKRQPRLSQMKLLPEIDKHGSIADTLTPGQELLVQIVKEPISSKGPRLTTEISFTGRYLVLTPFCDKISVSQKIKSSEERLRLRQLVESIKPRNFGVIIRTSAEGKRVAELNHELKALVQSFDDACAKAQKATAPALVFEEENRVVGMLRDVFSPSFENIYINDPDIHSQILKYVHLIAPDRTDIVKLYKKDEPIFDSFGITRQIKSSFGKTVSFKSGAYIIIEHTEALHVIDVNSGNRTKAGSDQESNALEVNLRAADEIARQLRLRDMGGIIVVDFIDMAKSEHRQQLYEHMREVMANDRARHNILPLSKFGLMQITRQRVRPVLDITTTEKCPSCHGKGEVQPSILFTETLFEKLEYLVEVLGKRDFIMYVHPFVDAYIKKGLFNTTYGKWRRHFGRCFRILPDQSLAYLQYRVVDADKNEIQLYSEKDSGQSDSGKTADKARRRGAEEEPAKAAKQPDKPKAKEPKQAQQPQKAKEQPKDQQAQKGKEQPKAKEQPKPKGEAQPKTAEPQQAKPRQPKEKEAPKAKAEAAPRPEAPAKVEAPAKPEDVAVEEPAKEQPKPRRAPKAREPKDERQQTSADHLLPMAEPEAEAREPRAEEVPVELPAVAPEPAELPAPKVDEAEPAEPEMADDDLDATDAEADAATDEAAAAPAKRHRRRRSRRRPKSAGTGETKNPEGSTEE